MFVVAGVTGNTGKVVAATLLAAGRKLRLVVRNADKARAWAERGAELFEANLDDPARMTEALRGAEGAYLLSPPDPTALDFLAERRSYVDRMAQAVERARPGHVVFLSSIGAQLPEGTGPILSVHHAEQVLPRSGVPITFIRASYFVENWAGALGVVKSDGVLPTFIAHDQVFPMVATHDIGVVSANALLDGPKGATRLIELAGPVDASPDDVASALSRVLGRTIRAAEAPLSAVVPTFTSFGMSPNAAQLYQDMYAAMHARRLVFQGSPAELIRGVKTVEETLKPLL